MDGVIKQLAQTLKEFADFKQQHPEFQQSKNRVTEVDEAEESS
jgi:hypothetical protein